MIGGFLRFTHCVVSSQEGGAGTSQGTGGRYSVIGICTLFEFLGCEVRLEIICGLRVGRV